MHFPETCRHGNGGVCHFCSFSSAQELVSIIRPGVRVVWQGEDLNHHRYFEEVLSET